MRSFLPLIMGLLLIGLPASAKHAFYRIVDVTTGASVDVPRFLEDEALSVDEPIGYDGARKVFYALRHGPDIEWTWRLRTISYDGKVLSEKPLPDFHCATYNHGFPSIACAMSPNGQSLLYCAAPSDGFSLSAGTPPIKQKENIRVYDLATAKRTPLLYSEHRPNWLGWVNDGKAVASVSEGIALIDIAKKEAGIVVEAKSAQYCSISPDGRWLAFFEAGGPVRLLNLENKEILTVSVEREGEDDEFCWSPDSSLLAYSTWRGCVKVYSVAEHREAMSIESKGPKSMFFLKNNQLAVKPWWASKDLLNAAAIYTYEIPGGQMTKLPQKFLGNVVPLTGSDKVLCLFDPTIDKTADKPLGLYGTTGEKVIGTIRGILGK